MPYSYEDLIKLPTREKLTHFLRNDKLFHILSAEQFHRDTLDLLFRLAGKLRRIATSREGMDFIRSLLSHKSAMLYFTQPSTRTYLSFVRACQYLGMSYAGVRDPRISSAFKGESDIDGVRTFSNYFDLIIMRHHEAGFAEKVAYMINQIDASIPVVSGGAGPDEHPTQALLDIYTLHESFQWRPKRIEGLNICFLGDVARGRTVRSLAKLLCRYDDINMTFVSPPELTIKDDLRTWLERKRVSFNETDNIIENIGAFDVIYVTRIQDEYDTGSDLHEIDYSPFHLTLEDVQKMKPKAIVMHPLPRREELDPRIDFDARAKYWEQERHGMWIRAALVSYIFNVEGKILDYYSMHHSY